MSCILCSSSEPMGTVEWQLHAFQYSYTIFFVWHFYCISHSERFLLNRDRSFGMPPTASVQDTQGTMEQRQSKLTCEYVGDIDGDDNSSIDSDFGSTTMEEEDYNVDYASKEEGDDDNNGTTIGNEDNVLLNKAHLTAFLESFCCSSCRARVKGIDYRTVGIATTVSYSCHSCKRKELLIQPECITTNHAAEVCANFYRRVSSYALNIKLVLMTQLIGKSHDAALIICGFLGLSATAFKYCWHTIEDDIGVHIRSLTETVVRENIWEECGGVERDKNGYIPIDVSGDGAWQTGGRRHDSISGHTMLIGKRSNKVVAYETYSKVCVKCSQAEKKKIQVQEHHCPKNYSGSSKGMECTGLFNCVLKLHNNYNIVVRRFVIDNDATTKAICKHSFKELIAAGRMKREEWPKSASRLTEKKDQGKLPLSHPPITFVADINH